MSSGVSPGGRVLARARHADAHRLPPCMALPGDPAGLAVAQHVAAARRGGDSEVPKN